MIVHTTTPNLAPASDWRLSDLLARLGDVAPERIRLVPAPGTATDEDCTESKDLYGCLCEMVDGVLVEKVMGWEEARLATELARLIGNYLEKHPLGIVFGPDGPIRIESRLIRMPDVSFVPWDRMPGDEPPPGPVMEIVPALAVEMISRSNRPGEMQKKLEEYFAAGVALVWYVYVQDRRARIHTSLKRSTEIGIDDRLDGRKVLPGFSVTLHELYDRAFPKRPTKRGT